MNTSKQTLYLFLVCLSLAFSACDKKFDDHNGINDPMLSEQLLGQINKNPDLSKFSEYLVKTGYDKILASSKTFTVWAPTNQALQAVDPNVINTDDKLKLFIANHIATQLFLTTALKQPFLRIKTLNGKNVTYTATTVDGGVMTSKDVYVGNGVLNVISTAIIPKVSAWEYLLSTNTLQKTELQSLTYNFYDLTKAEVTGINPTTGAPIYKPGTGLVTTNRFLDQVFPDRSNILRKPTDISNEDSTFTYIVLTDAAFNAEKTKLEKYYKVSRQDSTDSLTKFNVIKDLAFKGLLDKDNFPATAYSQGDSVKFYLNKNAVVQTINVSNGIVYVMSSINYELANGTYDVYAKLKPIIIEGETTNVTFQSARTLTRPIRRNPDGTVFTQLSVANHTVATYWARYLAPLANSAKYKVYWRVVRDDNMVPATVGGDLVYSPQRLAFRAAPATVTPGFNYIPKPGVVPVLNSAGQQIKDIDNKFVFAPDYSEMYLGDYTVDRFYSITLRTGTAGAAGGFPIYLVGNTTTANGTNTILLDYVKLVPLP